MYEINDIYLYREGDEFTTSVTSFTDLVDFPDLTDSFTSTNVSNGFATKKTSAMAYTL